MHATARPAPPARVPLPRSPGAIASGRRMAAACACLAGGLLACTPPAHGPPSFSPPGMDTAQIPLDMDAVLEASQEVSERMYAVRGNALTTVQALRGMYDEYGAGAPAHRQAVSLELLRMAPEVGGYAEALHHADLLYGTELLPPPAAPVPSLDGTRPVDALRFLADAAASHRVVMLNEAHHAPQHRAFVRALLAELHARGFRYFAAEALSERDTALNARGYPVPRSGPYLTEPVFGDVVRTALGLGYEVVPYESRIPDEDRDKVQATNLVRRILDRNPDARILVYAGWNHIDESGVLQGYPPMGTRFREMTGIDPFTVDQTVLSERAGRAMEHPLYAALADGRRLRRPTVFVGPDGAPWSLEPRLRDVTVVHPRSVYRDGRPAWLGMDGARRREALPRGVCGAADRCLVRARLRAEVPDGIPVDQVEVVRGRPVPVLLLPPGTYRIEVEDAAGAPITSYERTVRGR
jgi:hypothetical protein